MTTPNPTRWIAYGAKHGQRTTDFATGREAALSFFDHYPKARKVSVLEWQDEGDGRLVRKFNITLGAGGPATGPRSFRDMSKAEALALTV